MTNDPLTRYRASMLIARMREPDCAACDEDAEQEAAGSVTAGATLRWEVPVTARAQMPTWPAEHFEKFEVKGKDVPPLQVTPDGRIWGAAAGDSCFRNGQVTQCQTYRRDPDPELRNFHTHTTLLDNGETIRTGVIVAGAGHADIRMSAAEVKAFHDNSSTIFARVRAWEDNKGRLLVSGSVVPGLDEKFVAQVAGTPISIEAFPTAETHGQNTLISMVSVPTGAWPVLEK